MWTDFLRKFTYKLSREYTASIMSTDIPFGAHPASGAPPTATNVVQASSYFGAPSGNSPTDANPFHFTGAAPGASPSMFSQPGPPPQSLVAPGPPPSASDFFAPSNPNVNMFNPGVGAGGRSTESQHYPQPTFTGAFGVSGMTAVPPQPPSQTGNLLTTSTSEIPFQNSGGSGADFFNATAPQTHSEVAPPQGYTTWGVTNSDEEKRQPGFQRHSSAPTLPGAASVFGAPLPNPSNQPGNTGVNFFSSVASQQQQQHNSLQESELVHSSSTRPTHGQQDRPYSQQPPSPLQSQPEAAFGGSGSLSAPSTTLHQVLPSSDHQQQHHQATYEQPHHQQQFNQTGFNESSTSPVSPFRPPSNADTHSSVPPPGAGNSPDYHQMTNADCADSDRQLSMNPSAGMLPNQVHPGQVHPSLTEDLGMTNASHGSMANLRTNASTDADFTAISAAIEDATTPDEGAPAQWDTGQSLSNEDTSGSSRERNSSLNLDSKSVSSLLEGSQDDFSRYSPIRLMPPAPLGGEQSPQTHSTLPQQQYSSSGGVTLLPAAPHSGLDTQEKESREQLQFATEHGHEKKASDDLKDWEIVDSVPLASEVSQLPSSVRLLPPSSFASVSTGESFPLSSSASTSDAGVSQTMQQLSLEPSRPGDVIQPQPPPPPPSQGQGFHPNISTAVVTGPSLNPLPVNSEQKSGEKASPVVHSETNLTNLERPPAPPPMQSHPPTASVGYHRPSHSESHLSSNLPEPKEISSLITQIPFLTPITATTSLPSSHTTLLTQPPLACSSSTTAPLSLHTSASVTLVHPISSLQSRAHHQEQQHQSLPSSVESRGTFTATAGGSSQQQFQTEVASQPPVSTPLQPGGAFAQTNMGDRDVLQPQPHTDGSQPIVGNSTNTQSNLPTKVTSAFEVLPSTAPEQLHVPHPPSITAIPGNQQLQTAVQTSRPELSQPLSSLPQPQTTTSAFVQIQYQQQQRLVEASNLHGRPDLHVQPPLTQPLQPSQPAHTQAQPGLSTGPPPHVPSLTASSVTALPTYPSQSEAGTQPTTVTVSSIQLPQNPPPPTVSQPVQPQSSLEPQQQPTDKFQQQTQPPPQLQVTTGVTATTAHASSHYQEERHERGAEPSQPLPSHHDDHSYYHDPYYSERDRDSYYGDPRDTRYRAPSAFSEREADHYRHGYHHPMPDSRSRYDYSHYPDHPPEGGYGRYGPNYGYDDPYHMGGGYPPLYGPPGRPAPFRDEYGMPPPRTPYYDPYDPYGYHHHAHQHQRPYDPRYGGHYPPPPGGRGPYGSEYPPDPLYDYHQPSAYEHDPRLQHQQQSESGYDSHTYPPPPQQSYNPQEELNPAEASAIGGQTDNFEVSQFVESPNTRLPNRPNPQQVQHNSTAYLDPQQQQMPPQHEQQQYPDQPHAQYPGEQHGYHYPEQGHAQGVTDPWYDHTYPHEAYSQYQDIDGSYIAQPFYGQHQQVAGDYTVDDAPPEEPPIETTPPPPPRETPELFAHPHVRATFGFGGQLVTVLPSYPAGDSSSAIVEITFIKDIVDDDETRNIVEAVNGSPGPFIPGDTPKSHVVRFASREAQKCREKMSEVSGDQETSRRLEDEALLWDFLVLLCQQNGVVVNSDISDLLLKDNPPAIKSVPQSSVSVTQDETLETLRQLLFAGRKKDAVDMTCSKGLWGHALMLASRMDEQTRTYVVNRFTASLMNTDPLSTFYTLLLGRTPSAVKPEGLPRAGDWKPHLAMILANRMSKLENVSIISLGDSLLSQKRLHAAHLCYHLANVHLGAYGNVDSKYSLLGIDHSHLTVGSFLVPSDLHMTEVLEFAMSLSKQDFLMPHFQLFKFLHVLKLLELGFVSKALKYCEQISCSAVVKNPHCFAPVFLHLLVETSVRLHHLNSPFDLVENEFPTWLHQLQQLVSDALSTDYAPSLLSPSPAFSSVSQSYATQQQQSTQQPIIGLQANTTSTGMGGFLNVPGTGGSRVESGASSKEGSVINMKIDVTTAHLAMGSAPTNSAADDINVQSQEASQPVMTQREQQQESQQGLMQPLQTYDPAHFPTGYDPSLATSMAAQQQLNSGIELQGQPQFQIGTSDTGYGQFGASAISSEHTDGQVVSTSGTSSENPSGSYNMQAQVHQGQLYGAVSQQDPMMSQVPTGSQQQVGNTGSAAGVGEGPQMGYDSYYGTTQPQVEQPSQPHPSSTQPGYPPQPTYDYSQWQGTQHTTSDISGGVLRQQELESSSSSRREGAESVGSGDSHVTGKKAGEAKESRGRDESKKGDKSGKGGQQQRQAKAGGGWGFSIMKYILPKKKNAAHLPDDKNPSIIWDEEKKKWIDLTADEEDQSAPPPPPTDSELSHKGPANAVAPPPGGGSAPPPSMTSSSGPSSSSVASGPSGGGMESTDQGPSRNTYSMKRSRRGLRSKYVDVLNPGGTKPGSSSTGGGPPPPGPPLMGGMMPGPPQPFSGTFFVPQQPPVDDNQDGGGAKATETPPISVSEVTTDHSGAPLGTTPSSDVTGSGHPVTEDQVAQQPAIPPQGESFTQIGVSSGGQPQLDQAHSNLHHVDSQRVAGVSSAGGQAPVPQHLPQFFNPSAFAPVSSFPQSLPGTNPAEPHDDALSTVSLISESSQEVSQYMNRQVPPTSSAGYNRLRQGIRGVKPYPSLPGQPQRPHPGHAHRPGGSQQSGPPPVGAVRNSFQPRQPQPWQ